MTERRHTYQTGKIRGEKRRPGYDMRKFEIKPGKYYYFVPIKHFKSKKKAQKWIKQDRKERINRYYRIITNPKSTYLKIRRKYTVYAAFYP